MKSVVFTDLQMSLPLLMHTSSERVCFAQDARVELYCSKQGRCELVLKNFIAAYRNNHGSALEDTIVTCRLLLIVGSHEITDAVVLRKFNVSLTKKVKEPRPGKTCSNQQS